MTIFNLFVKIAEKAGVDDPQLFSIQSLWDEIMLNHPFLNDYLEQELSAEEQSAVEDYMKNHLNAEEKEKLKEQQKILAIFEADQICLPSYNWHVLSKNGKQGVAGANDDQWILPPEYNHIRLREPGELHSDFGYAIAEDFKGQYWLFNLKNGSRINDHPWDECYPAGIYIATFRTGAKKGIYNFKNGEKFYPLFEYDMQRIGHVDDHFKYFLVSNPETGKYAVADKKFRLLTDFVFFHPVNYDEQYKEFIVTAANPAEADFLACYRYKKPTFVKLFSEDWRARAGALGEYADGRLIFPRKVEKVRKKPFIQCAVAGTYYYHLDNIGGLLNVGDKILLEPEPDNPYDRYAVKVIREIDKEYYQIGYIPQFYSEQVCLMIRSGHVLEAEICLIDPVGREWVIYLDIFLKKEQEDGE